MERSMFIPRHLLIAAIGIALASVSCKKDDWKKINGNDDPFKYDDSKNGGDDAPGSDDLSTAMYLDAMDGLQTEGSESVEMNLFGDEGIPTAILEDPFEEGLSTRSRGSDDGYDDRKKDDKKCRLPESLKLSERQKEALKKAYAEFKDCKKDVEYALRKLNKMILQKARDRRNELLEAHKNGRITREELAKALRQLNERTQNALKNNPQREELVAKLRKCHKHYLETIKSILSEEQWKYFTRCHRLHFKNHR